MRITWGGVLIVAVAVLLLARVHLFPAPSSTISSVEVAGVSYQIREGEAAGEWIAIAAMRETPIEGAEIAVAEATGCSVVSSSHPPARSFVMVRAACP